MNTLVISAKTGAVSSATVEDARDPAEYARQAALTRLQDLDAKMPRALEDLIAATGKRNELPDVVKSVIEAKEAERAKL